MVQVSVLCNRQLSSHQVIALREMLDAEAELSLVVVNREGGTRSAFGDDTSKPSNPVRSFVKLFRDKRWWALVQAERWLSKQLGLRSRSEAYQGSVAIEDIPEFDDVEIVECSPVLVDGGPWKELPDEIVKRIAEESDIVVRFGFGLITGDVLTAPDYGVLSFHPANIEEIRGLGPEIAFYQDRSRVGVTLQRPNESIDGGEIIGIADVDVNGPYTLEQILVEQRKLYGDLLREGVKNVSDPSFELAVPDELGEYHPIDTKEKFRFAAVIAGRNFVRRLYQWLSGEPISTE